MSDTIKIAVIDDEVLFRKSIVFLLDSETDFEIVFDGNNGQEFIHHLKTNTADKHPDIALMDIRMPVMNGIETSKLLLEDFPHVKIISLSSFDSDHFIELMVQHGACAYLAKNSQPEKVTHTIRSVYKNGVHFEMDKISIILNMKRDDKTKKLTFSGLSDREIEVLHLICQEFSTKEIADKLCISERTVEGHRKNMMKKTNSKNVVGLILWGVKNQLFAIE